MTSNQSLLIAIDENIFNLYQMKQWVHFYFHDLWKIRDEGGMRSKFGEDKWCDLFILANIVSLRLPSCVNHSPSTGSGVAAVYWGVGVSNVFCNVLIGCNSNGVKGCNVMISTLQIALWSFCQAAGNLCLTSTDVSICKSDRAEGWGNLSGWRGRFSDSQVAVNIQGQSLTSVSISGWVGLSILSLNVSLNISNICLLLLLLKLNQY